MCELRPTLELLGKVTGDLQTGSTTVQQLFVSLGVRGETELRQALELARAEVPTLEQARDRAV